MDNVKFGFYRGDTYSRDFTIEGYENNIDDIHFTVKEVETDKFYYLNENTVNVDIEKDKQEVIVNITNESKNPSLDIEKNGPDTAEVGAKIEYDISIRNTGNTYLDNFTMIDTLPSKFVEVTKFQTGTYNQDLTYNLSYKTNISGGYILLMEDLKTKENYDINFKDELADNEFVTEIKLEFGKVDIGFSSNENPHIIGIVKATVKSGEIFTNKANVSGNYDEFKVQDKSKWKKKSYKLLPKTGF